MSDLSEFLAVEVMRYELRFSDADRICGPGEYWFDKKGYRHGSKKAFRPSENIEQAMMCLEQFVWWNIERFEDGSGFRVMVEGYGGTEDELLVRESLTMAISLACARARGWDE